jgi:hypothetical protein
MVPCPDLCRSARRLEAASEVAGGVGECGGVMPCREDTREEKLIVEPCIFKPEDVCFGDGRGHVSNDWSVIRGGANTSCQRGLRESGAVISLTTILIAHYIPALRLHTMSQLGTGDIKLTMAPSLTS